MRHPATVEVRAVDGRVQQFGLGLIAFVHLYQAALLFQPFEHQAGQVPGKGRRRVEHGIVFGQHGVIEDGRDFATRFAQQIFTYDHQGQAGRPNVFLRTGVNYAETADVQRTRQNGGGVIANHHFIAKVR
ncbi:hypothetical protein D3C72_1124360 [compost metagenome]